MVQYNHFVRYSYENYLVDIVGRQSRHIIFEDQDY